MSESHSTQSAKPAKPSKPYPDFPLTPHRGAKQWCKKIRGKLHYFGPLDNPDAALQKYLDQKDDLHAGRTPRPDPAALMVKDVANAFLNGKQALVDAGELSPRTWVEYKAMADELVVHAGKARLVADLRPDDFASLRNRLAKKWGPHRLRKAIQYLRSMFKFAYDAELIDRPVRYGPGFNRPSLKTLRLHRAKQGLKLFSADEIRRLLPVASIPMKAMLLLGINCGFGNADCGRLPRSAVDLDRGWIDYPRPKTGVARRCPLWPETVQALREAIATRPEPKQTEHAGLVFITMFGTAWFKGTCDCPITQEMARLLRRLGINGRKGLGFYTLRHTFRTVADEAKDQPAADFIMGHEVAHVSSVYRETISDERLKAVADHVRRWLFGAAAEVAKAPSPGE
jgi:integrase